MTTSSAAITIDKDTKIPPRERLLTAAADLFYRQGIRAVGVESIAEAAGTNKMTLYRHFESKDELVTEYLRRLAAASMGEWDRLTAANSGDPRGELRAWLQAMAAHVASGDERGCALVNAAVELPDKAHPARRVIEQLKVEQRDRLIKVCEASRLSDPDLLADELFLLLEGARVTAQSMGPQGLGERLIRMGDAMIKAHER